MALFLRSVLRTNHNQTMVAARCFSRSTIKYNKAASTATASEADVENGKLSGKTHPVNNFEKRMLVWAGKYHKVGDVPSWVTPESVEKARNRARIRLANYMMIATAFACLIVVISGKKAAERGETLQQVNLEWHRRVNEQAEKDEAK